MLRRRFFATLGRGWVHLALTDLLEKTEPYRRRGKAKRFQLRTGFPVARNPVSYRASRTTRFGLKGALKRPPSQARGQARYQRTAAEYGEGSGSGNSYTRALDIVFKTGKGVSCIPVGPGA